MVTLTNPTVFMELSTMCTREEHKMSFPRNTQRASNFMLLTSISSQRTIHFRSEEWESNGRKMGLAVTYSSFFGKRRKDLKGRTSFRKRVQGRAQ
ncbi:hypothetical protein TNIN_110361 [Trichonephila inaurata madagascariensis]|uniref:Uncharacterized protein n=1 Tax=Trichonephila inaurata madagascariensis TaxID=2747483 RepID=A0A8X7BYR6_9ARAC|nr:hypothetical protein TNIN_110361 [Trichonephila inaurata madagascariensis]